MRHVEGFWSALARSTILTYKGGCFKIIQKLYICYMVICISFYNKNVKTKQKLTTKFGIT